MWWSFFFSSVGCLFAGELCTNEQLVREFSTPWPECLLNWLIILNVSECITLQISPCTSMQRPWILLAIQKARCLEFYFKICVWGKGVILWYWSFTELPVVGRPSWAWRGGICYFHCMYPPLYMRVDPTTFIFLSLHHHYCLILLVIAGIWSPFQMRIYCLQVLHNLALLDFKIWDHWTRKGFDTLPLFNDWAS